MILCGSDIVTILILALSIVGAFVGGKKKTPKKHIVTRTGFGDDLFVDPNEGEKDDVRKGTPVVESAPLQGTDVEVHKTLREERRGVDIDKKKLIIYSEIMKPKFDE